MRTCLRCVMSGTIPDEYYLSLSIALLGLQEVAFVFTALPSIKPLLLPTCGADVAKPLNAVAISGLCDAEAQ